ncbi:MAG: hypothetical protein HC845_14140 [Akkermansiaceae bacterium]|nr:hypothetical protein [Akkermansiaceae bacterium]
MKSIIHQITTVAVAIIIASATALESRATDLFLEGSGYFELDKKVKFFGDRGKKQSGKFKYLGADFYRKAEVGIDEVVNDSKFRSGTMSFEFWAMDFFGAESGIILMTHKVSPLKARRFYDGLDRRGYAIFLDERRYPELSLWEFTIDGWEFRDALSFSRKSRL